MINQFKAISETLNTPETAAYLSDAAKLGLINSLNAIGEVIAALTKLKPFSAGMLIGNVSGQIVPDFQY